MGPQRTTSSVKEGTQGKVSKHLGMLNVFLGKTENTLGNCQGLPDDNQDKSMQVLPTITPFVTPTRFSFTYLGVRFPHAKMVLAWETQLWREISFANVSHSVKMAWESRMPKHFWRGMAWETPGLAWDHVF